MAIISRNTDDTTNIEFIQLVRADRLRRRSFADQSFRIVDERHQGPTFLLAPIIFHVLTQLLKYRRLSELAGDGDALGCQEKIRPRAGGVARRATLRADVIEVQRK